MSDDLQKFMAEIFGSEEWAEPCTEFEVKFGVLRNGNWVSGIEASDWDKISTALAESKSWEGSEVSEREVFINYDLRMVDGATERKKILKNKVFTSKNSPLAVKASLSSEEPCDEKFHPKLYRWIERHKYKYKGLFTYDVSKVVQKRTCENGVCVVNEVEIEALKNPDRDAKHMALSMVAKVRDILLMLRKEQPHSFKEYQ